MRANNYKLIILIITGILFSAYDSDANQIKNNYAQFAQNSQRIPESRMTSMPDIGGKHKKDSLPSGVNTDWLNKLRDESGKRIMPEEYEPDFIQRNIFDPSGPLESFGTSVSSAGDVNGDGYEDIIIGAQRYNSSVGRAYIFFGGTNWDTDPDVILTGEALSEFGSSVSSGDVNKDGFSDVIVGAGRYNNNTGKVYIFFGGASMNSTADVTMTGDGTENYFGQSASSAGDMNKDGYCDVIVGAGGYYSNTGCVYVYYGGSSMNNIADMVVTGPANSYFGNSVSSAGDVNGDGYADAIVGAFWANMAYIFYGGEFVNATADIIMTGTEGFFGTSVATAGDVNGDGFSDVLVGAYRYGSTDVGKVYLYLGGTSMNNAEDLTITGTEPYGLLGMRLSSAGDINRDGYSDIIVGAAHDFSPADTGKAYVYFGGASMNNIADLTMSGESLADDFGVSVAATGDFNGDGFTELIVGASEYNSQRGRVYFYEYNVSGNITSDTVKRITGPGPNEGFGMSVSSAGDVNKDGFDDIIIGSAWNASTGKAYIFLGGYVFDTIPDVIMTGEAGQNSEFGKVVSSAGDVNGDGYSDVIVGAVHYNSNTGRAYIYFGGATMNNVADIIMTGETTDRYLGSSVSSDDFNRDGFSDVLIGEPGYNSYTGRAHILFGGAEMDTIPDVTMTGESNNSYFGMVSSPAGDVNGDSYPDVIISAMNYGGETGRAYIYYGGSTMNNEVDLILNGENGHFGEATASGDLNGDGYSDIIASAYRFGSDDAGKVYIYYGGNPMNNTADLTFNGTESNALLGMTLACAGDLNKDGYSDIIMPSKGKAYIYFGGASMDTIPDIIRNEDTPGENYAFVSAGGDINGDGDLEYIIGAPWFNSNAGKVYIYEYRTNANVISDLTMTGEGTNNYFGSSVSSAGDVNKDGYDDILVGAPGYNSQRGRAYIFFGGMPMDNTADVTMTGITSNNYFGGSVSSAGDVNGDGYSDVIVGAMYAGKANIYFGGTAMDNIADVLLDEGEGGYYGSCVSSAGDVNGDNYSDVIVSAYRYGSNAGRTYVYFGGSPMNNISDLVMTGDEPSALFGMSVSTAGDLNRDGYSDIIVGAAHELTVSDTGEVYIYFGGTTMDNIADITMRGEQIKDDFGGTVSSAGDVNGDGFSDVMVGAITFNNIYNSQDGRVYIYFGGTSMDTSKDVTFYGETGSQFGRFSSKAGDMNGDGYSDVIIGAEKPDSSTGRAYIYYGGAQMNNSVDIVLNGEAINSEFGTSVSSGDFNKDGYSDVIVGAHKYSTNTGRAYVYLASAIGLPDNKEYRSKVSGNWNSPLTWEMSSDGGTNWVAATSSPNSSSGTITIKSSHIVTVTKNDNANYIVVENGAQLTVNSPDTLIVNSLSNGGILSVNGKLISEGTIEYNGTSPQILVTANVRYANLTINNPSGVTLTSDFSIPGLLSVINGDLNLNGKTITLSDTARLQETPGNTVMGDSGSITTTRNINQPELLNIGGLGAVFTSSENFGLTTITRKHDVQSVNNGNPSIKRNYTISTQNHTALNASFIFKYDTSELDTINESSLGLYHSTDGGANYDSEGGSVDIANNQISINYIQSFSKWTAARDTNRMSNNLELTENLYSKGKICIKWGSNDTIGVRINNLQFPGNDSVKINYVIKHRETFEIIFDTILTFPNFISQDTLIHLTLPRIIDPGPHSVIVQAIPDELDPPINGYDIQGYCFDVTCDAFSYIQPCDTIDGGAGFDGTTGRMVAGFRNLNATEDFPIHAIDQSFLDSGAGNVPYKLAVYADNGNGKPGNVLYMSPPLLTPPGNNYVQTVTQPIEPPLNIPPNTKFYIGYIQTSAANIKVSYQDEIPVRSSAFFFSNSDTGNAWVDFSDSSSGSAKKFRFEISPKTSSSAAMNSSGISLTLYALLEGLYNYDTDKMRENTIKVEIRSFISPNDIIDSCKAILDSNGRGIFNFTNLNINSQYYFVVRHRNHLETWSHNSPESFEPCGKQYDFTDNISKALGDNLKLINGKYMIFSGDVNQDGTVDASDLSNVENDASVSLEGNVNTDITGDDYVDASDLSIVENNTSQGIYAITP